MPVVHVGHNRVGQRIARRERPSDQIGSFCAELGNQT
jgi:hypothetical protein